MRKLLLTVVALVTLALAISACGSNGTNSSTSKGAATTTTTQAAPATSAPTTSSPSTTAAPATTAPSTAPTTAPSSGSVPTYQPSTVVSQAAGHTQLTTPDNVAKVTAFYKQALSQNGWTLTSSTTTAASANFVAKRSGMGATVAISTMGPTGTSISISTYSG
jgi:hypothetical protein